MKTEMKTGEVLRIEFRQERDDPDYGSCRWADFVFDTEHFELSVFSDRGDYAHVWPVDKGHPFLKLMAGISGDYLLRKMFREEVVDWESTKEWLVEAVNVADATEEERETALRELEELEEEYDLTDDYGATMRLVEEWNDNNLEIEDVWECVKTDYTYDAKKIVDVFIRVVQPVLYAKLYCPDGYMPMSKS